jgi:hypothetical protein
MSDAEGVKLGLEVGCDAFVDLLDEKKRRIGERVQVTITKVRTYEGAPYSFEITATTGDGVKFKRWVEAQYIHAEDLPKPEGALE